MMSVASYDFHAVKSNGLSKESFHVARQVEGVDASPNAMCLAMVLVLFRVDLTHVNAESTRQSCYEYHELDERPEEASSTRGDDGEDFDEMLENGMLWARLVIFLMCPGKLCLGQASWIHQWIMSCPCQEWLRGVALRFGY